MLALAEGWFDWLPTPPESLPIRILIAVGIAAAGALLCGLLVQVLSKSIARSAAPKPAVNLVRLGGAAAAGLAACLWLFGLGPGKGPGQGPGKGPGEGGEKRAILDPGKGEEKKDDKKTNPPVTPAGEEVLKIEVLGNKSVRKLADQKAIEENRRYRLTTDSGPKLLTIDEVVNFIAERSRDKRTPDRVELISYKSETRPQDKEAALERLRELGRDLKKDLLKWIKAPDLDESPSL